MRVSFNNKSNFLDINRIKGSIEYLQICIKIYLNIIFLFNTTTKYNSNRNKDSGQLTC